MLRAAVVLAAAAGGVAAAPLPPSDPFMPGTRWAGELTQRGTLGGPTAFSSVLTVTARDDDRFVGEIASVAGAMRVNYVVKGTIARSAYREGYEVRFRSTDVKYAEGAAPVLNVAYGGTLSGDGIRGGWKLPPTPHGGTLEGEFTLTRARTSRP